MTPGLRQVFHWVRTIQIFTDGQQTSSSYYTGGFHVSCISRAVLAELAAEGLLKAKGAGTNRTQAGGRARKFGPL